MSDELASSNAYASGFSTNNYGHRNATYNNSTIVHNNYRDASAPESLPGIKKLAGHVAPTALHSSSSRNARTGCLEGTRVGLVERLSRWVEDPSKKDRVCWVQGGAGVGKSAVAQTICENYRRKSRLAASFFFSRNDTQRSTLDPFIPTIAHQLATLPAFKNTLLPTSIDDAIRQSPNELEGTNLEGQFQSLIFQPCASIEWERWKELPTLVVIDGFDECMAGPKAPHPSHAQEALLSMIHKATFSDPPLPLHFMIFSRPERTILNFFKTILPHKLVDMRDFNAQVDGDIRRYLEKQFANIADSYLEILLDGIWPGEEAIDKLVLKADGHFIYVVTVMKYITGNNPSDFSVLQERLDIVLHTAETSSYPDLSDLDQLYYTILRPFGQGALRRILLPILQLIITPHPQDVQIDTQRGRSQLLIAALLNIDIRRCSLLLSQFRSVLHVPEEGGDEAVSILHASFSDFLTEERRSHDFHVQPMRTTPYLDLFSSCLLSRLKQSISQYQRGEPMDFAGRTIQLELWSLNPWSSVEALLTSSTKNYTPSEELISAIIDFDVYGYLNMILDQEFMKAALRKVKSADQFWTNLVSRIELKPQESPGRDPVPHIERSYHRRQWAEPSYKNRKFYHHMFMMLVNNLFYLRVICRTLESAPPESSLRLCYSHLCQFFEEDWLVILPSKNRSKRKVSRSHLGSLILPASASLSGTKLAHIVELLTRTTKDYSSTSSTLKVFPHRELQRAEAEIGGDRSFEICSISWQQRKLFAEEAELSSRSIVVPVRTTAGGAHLPQAGFSYSELHEAQVLTDVFDGLVANILTHTPTELTKPNDTEDSGDEAEGVALLAPFKILSRCFCGICS
ncbi:hypothetical protein PM082_014521 [Marasmius tenuissimus]|nr:hypothetical protein PM082_014521 [Marasmius tenuissimus]